MKGKLAIIAILLLVLSKPGKAQTEPARTSSRFRLTVGGMLRGRVLDHGFDLQVFQFTNFFDNTVGRGANIGVQYALGESDYFLELNTNIRIDHSNWVRDSVSYGVIGEKEQLLFDPFIGIGRRFKLDDNMNLYAQVGYHQINAGAKFRFIGPVNDPQVFNLSYPAASLAVGLEWGRLLFEPRMHYVRPGDFPFERFRPHFMGGMRVAYILKFLNKAHFAK